MAKTKKLLVENLKLVDIIIELLDARIPVSSQNPEFEQLLLSKPRVLVMNKTDLADSIQSQCWNKWFIEQGFRTVCIDSKSGLGFSKLKQILDKMFKEKLENRKIKGRIFSSMKLMIVGIPNVGKSSFINRMARRSCAVVQDKPGVTKGKQWIRVNKEFQLLDTPGVLWPKFETEEIGFALASTGSIKQQLFDQIEVAVWLLEKIKDRYSDKLENRYNVANAQSKNGYQLLEELALARKYVLSRAKPDLLRAAMVLLDEFQGGKIGRITLEILKNNSFGR